LVCAESCHVKRLPSAACNGMINHMKKRTIILSVIITVISASAAFFFLRFSLLPKPASMEMQQIDLLLRVLLGIAGIIFVSIVAILAYILIFFRRPPGDLAEGPPMKGNAPLELAWTVIPLVIVVGVAIFGGRVLQRMEMPGPAQSEMEVRVIAARFSFTFEYPEYGITTSELGLPADRRVWLRMTSRDVVHSFWVPEFGPKQDLVPGITTELRFTPNKAGKYKVICAEQCGLGHTFMSAPVIVASPEDFRNWAQQQEGRK